MSSINKVVLLGNLGSAPEFRVTSRHRQFCVLRLATSNSWNERDGHRKQRVEWHRVVIFDHNLIELARLRLSKGSKVYVEGKLQTSTYNNQHGIVQQSTQIVLSFFGGVLVPLQNVNSRSPYIQNYPQNPVSVRNYSSDSQYQQINEQVGVPSVSNIELDEISAAEYTQQQMESADAWLKKELEEQEELEWEREQEELEREEDQLRRLQEEEDEKYDDMIYQMKFYAELREAYIAQNWENYYTYNDD